MDMEMTRKVTKALYDVGAQLTTIRDMSAPFQTNPRVEALTVILKDRVVTAQSASALFSATPADASALIKVISQFVELDTASLLALAKAAPTRGAKITLYVLVLRNVVKWIINLVKSHTSSSTK